MSKTKPAKMLALAEQVRLYIETDAGYVGPGPAPQEPMGKKARGKSRPPASPKAMAFWEANRHASQLIEWRMSSLCTHDVSYAGVSFSYLVLEVYRNPAVTQNWKAEGTKSDEAENAAFDKLCYLIAQSILASNPHEQIRVIVNPKVKDEPANAASSAEDDPTPLQKQDGAPHHRVRRYNAEYAYRKRYEKLLDIESKHDITRSAAVALVADESGVGVATIWTAVSFCEQGPS